MGYHQRPNGVPFDSTRTDYWDGASWKRQPSPNLGTDYDFLNNVAATSSNNAWAVGYFNNFGGLDRTIAMHWNGSAWGP